MNIPQKYEDVVAKLDAALAEVDRLKNIDHRQIHELTPMALRVSDQVKVLLARSLPVSKRIVHVTFHFQILYA